MMPGERLHLSMTEINGACSCRVYHDASERPCLCDDAQEHDGDDAGRDDDIPACHGAAEEAVPDVDGGDGDGIRKARGAPHRPRRSAAAATAM